LNKRVKVVLQLQTLLKLQANAQNSHSSPAAANDDFNETSLLY